MRYQIPLFLLFPLFFALSSPLHALKASDFRVNTAFLKNPFRRYVLVPTDLLHFVLTAPEKPRVRPVYYHDRSSLEDEPIVLHDPRRVENGSRVMLRPTLRHKKDDKDDPKGSESKGSSVVNEHCTTPIATEACCYHWYIPDTLQYSECMLDAKGELGIKYHEDEFNACDKNEAMDCIYKDLSALDACCEWLSVTSVDDKDTCVKTRENVVKNGLRVCFIDDEEQRSSCCDAIFKGRSFLHERCVDGIPTFINRVAPCAFRPRDDQEQCCRQLFPQTGFMDRAYLNCADAVGHHEKNVNICFKEDDDEKEECCSTEKLYGNIPHEACLDQTVPPCRVEDFDKRVACCCNQFPKSQEQRNRCMTWEFRTCQLSGWKDRLACCASGFRVGSTEMRECLFQYVHPFEEGKESKRLSRCTEYYPPGSRQFEKCLYYPIKLCEVMSSSAQEMEKCCNKYFKADSSGFAACASGATPYELMASYYAQDPMLTRLSDPTATAAERVQYCQSQFPMTGAVSPWYRLACLTDITFSLDEQRLYYFTLFSDSTVTVDVQFSCAIYSEVEREGCCMVFFPRTSSSFETCMSWDPSLARKVSVEASQVEEAELEDVLEEAVSSAADVEPPPDSLAGLKLRLQLETFLKRMKQVEVKRLKRGGKPGGSGAKLEAAYDRFGELFFDAVRQGWSATFFHVAKKRWMSCALVRSAEAPLDAGVCYCADLRLIGGGAGVPPRQPVYGWDGGAVEAVVGGQRGRRRRVRARGVRREATLVDLGAPGGGGAPQTGPDEAGEREASADATMVNLFGDAASCMVTNLRHECYSLCCDSYFAYSWLCAAESLPCF